MKNLRNTIVLLTCMFASNTVFAADEVSTYIEVFGGATNSIFGSPDAGTKTAGAAFSGLLFDIDHDPDAVLGLRLGYKMSNRWRFDISYYDMGADIDWRTNFVGCCVGNFDAKLDIQALLINAYYSFDSVNNFTPYVGAGIGYSRNRLSSINESYDGFGLYANPETNTETELAYRVAAGLEYELSKAWFANIEFSMMNIGDASSGDTRNIVMGGSQTIGEYEFDDIWVGSLSIGIQYNF